MHSTQRAVALFRMALAGLVLLLPLPAFAADGKIEQPGVVVAYEQARLDARIPGIVKEWKADLGDRVRKGDILAELYTPDLAAEYEGKKARVQKAEVGIEQAKRKMAVAEAAALAAKAKVDEANAGLLAAQAEYDRWKAEYERTVRLAKESVIDRATVDDVLRHVKSAEAGVQQAKARILAAKAESEEASARRENARTDVEAAQAGVKVAQADMQRVQALLEFTRIQAPFDGVVTRRNVSTGDFVGPTAKGNSGPMFVVSRLDRVRIVVEVPELQALLVTPGTKAVIRFQALKEKTFMATVARTSASLDPSARTLKVEFDVPNPENKLLPGMYADVQLLVRTPESKK